MTTYYLASDEGVYVPPPVVPAKVYPLRPLLLLESLDRTVQIPLDGTTGWIRMPGATGLEMPPYEVVGGAIPGVAGGALLDVRVDTRPIFIPLYVGGEGNHLSFLSMMNLLRRVVDPTTGQFRLVGRTATGEREMTVTYISGLEGADAIDQQGLTWAKVGLNCMAFEPFARAREERALEFRMAPIDNPFMGLDGGTDAPWPVALASGSVIGSGMEVTINSDVPIYPVLELDGPMDSFIGTLSPTVVSPDGSIRVLDDQAWSVEITGSIPAGSTFRMVTDPRQRSIRLNGAPAAGRVALGSTLRAFYPGRNQLNVTAPGGGDTTKIRLSWRNQYRSLW